MNRVLLLHDEAASLMMLPDNKVSIPYESGLTFTRVTNTYNYDNILSFQSPMNRVLLLHPAIPALSAEIEEALCHFRFPFHYIP